MLSTEDAFIADCVQAGARFVGVGIDVLAYVGALRARARQFISR